MVTGSVREVAIMGEVGPAQNLAQAQRWNGASGQYWIEHRERHLAEHRYLTPHLFRSAAIKPGDRVLDVGCGCGDTTMAAARAAGARRGEGAAVGLDLSAPMLTFARRMAAQADVANARFVRGDAQACPLRCAAFDVVISNFGVMFFDDPVAAFSGLAAVVRPYGRLAFLCWQDDNQNEVLAIPLRAFGAHMELPGPAAAELFVDPGHIIELLSVTGWQDIRVAPVNEQARIGSDVKDVMSYIRGMPVIRTLTASLDPVLTARVLTAITRQYRAREGPDGIWVHAAAWLVTARRAT
jgi:SAM-dependent methyltransferase